jgi:hypothetical protein
LISTQDKRKGNTIFKVCLPDEPETSFLDERNIGLLDEILLLERIFKDVL